MSSYSGHKYAKPNVQVCVVKGGNKHGVRLSRVGQHNHGGPGVKGQDKVSDKREMVVELSDPVAAEFPMERFFS